MDFESVRESNSLKLLLNEKKQLCIDGFDWFLVDWLMVTPFCPLGTHISSKKIIVLMDWLVGWLMVTPFLSSQDSHFSSKFLNLKARFLGKTDKIDHAFFFSGKPYVC